MISSVPALAMSKLGKALTDAGVLNVEGDYECIFATDGMNVIEAVLKPSAVTGAFAPTLRSLYLDRSTTRASDAGANFAAGVAETLTLSDLHGANTAKVTFSIPAGGSITFDPTAGALAEACGL